MELNAEINKVVGKEIAVLLAEKIPAEEMEKMSQTIWETITKRSYSYGREEKSALEKLIEQRITSKVMEKVDEISKEEVPMEKIKEEAERIVEEARAQAHVLMVNEIANAMTHAALSHASELTYAVHEGTVRIAESITRNNI